MPSFYELRLCETAEYSPRILEHWLHMRQNHSEPLHIILLERNGKVQMFCNEDLSIHLRGSRFVKSSTPQVPHRPYYVRQRKGPLLPIKRYTQFEDRTQKTHIAPLDTLIPVLAQTPGACIHLKLKAFSNKKRERALKKVKKPFFEPERRFDQWESKAWFSLKARRFLGPLLRKALLHSPLKNPPSEQMESSHEREDPRRAVLDKLSRPLFSVELRMSHPFHEFIHGFNLPYLGELELNTQKTSCLLSAEELASMLSLPNAKNLAGQLCTEPTAYLPGPKNWMLVEEDRKRHLYIMGKTGMGKSTALLTLFKEDLSCARSTVLIDPHGDLIEDALKLIPQAREQDVLLLDPSDEAFPLAINPVELLPGEDSNLKTSALVEMFEVLSKGSWGPRLEHILRNALLLLVQSPNTTLLDLPRLLTNEKTCRAWLKQNNDFELHRFFEDEFLALENKVRQEHIAPILNKVGPLLTLPLLRNSFGQPRSKLKLEAAFDAKKIILISLSKGKLGEDASRILGMIFIAMIQSTLLKRASREASERNTVCLTLDEFQNFTTKTLLSMLAESRKYGLALTLANQYLSQIPPEIQDAVLGNAGSMLCFRSSYADAQILAPSLGITEEDLTHLSPFQAYAKLLHNQTPLPLYRLDVHKCDPAQNTLDRTRLCERMHKQFCRPQSLVEEKLKNRYNKR